VTFPETKNGEARSVRQASGRAAEATERGGAVDHTFEEAERLIAACAMHLRPLVLFLASDMRAPVPIIARVGSMSLAKIDQDVRVERARRLVDHRALGGMMEHRGDRRVNLAVERGRRGACRCTLGS
jgi:hypothetical protein